MKVAMSKIAATRAKRIHLPHRLPDVAIYMAQATRTHSTEVPDETGLAEVDLSAQDGTGQESCPALAVHERLRRDPTLIARFAWLEGDRDECTIATRRGGTIAHVIVFGRGTADQLRVQLKSERSTMAAWAKRAGWEPPWSWVGNTILPRIDELLHGADDWNVYVTVSNGLRTCALAEIFERLRIQRIYDQCPPARLLKPNPQRALQPERFVPADRWQKLVHRDIKYHVQFVGEEDSSYRVCQGGTGAATPDDIRPLGEGRYFSAHQGLAKPFTDDYGTPVFLPALHVSVGLRYMSEVGVEVQVEDFSFPFGHGKPEMLVQGSSQYPLRVFHAIYPDFALVDLVLNQAVNAATLVRQMLDGAPVHRVDLLGAHMASSVLQMPGATHHRQKVSTRSQFAAASLGELAAKLLPSVPDDAIERLEEIIHHSQRHHPPDKKAFIRDVNRLLDGCDLRLRVPQGLARLVFKRGSIQFAVSGAGTLGFGNREVRVERVPASYGRKTRPPTAHPS